ncbi:MAG: hypothetical protein FWF82_00445 [Oscillospiraceae bacterium]|nr:hypothetical protein [Oscillospiraceae bacterium]
MASKNITVDETEMRAILGSIIGELFSNVGAKMTAELSGGQSVKASATVKKAESELPSKDELVKIVSGYLHMTLGEMNYSRKEIIPIIQRLEKKIKVNDYESAMTAYENAENNLSPVIIMGIVIPFELYDVKIADLKYDDGKLGERVTRALNREGIVTVKDFRKRPDLANRIRLIKSFGKGCQDEFLSALRSTVEGGAEAVKTAVNTPAKTSKTPRKNAAKTPRVAKTAKTPKVTKVAKTPRTPKATTKKSESATAKKVTATAKTPRKSTVKKVTAPAKMTTRARTGISADGVIAGIKVPEEIQKYKIDQLDFVSKISKTKTVNSLKEKGIVYVSDFFKPEHAVFHKIGLSVKGRQSLVETLKRTVEK